MMSSLPPALSHRPAFIRCAALADRADDTKTWHVTFGSRSGRLQHCAKHLEQLQEILLPAAMGPVYTA